jgi:hypothetical protein
MRDDTDDEEWNAFVAWVQEMIEGNNSLQTAINGRGFHYERVPLHDEFQQPDGTRPVRVIR